jgi:flagellar hook assembly protein FlgD
MAYQDLLKDTSAVAPDDNNKFIVTILDLDVSTIYKTQFRWKYKDKTFGEWSAVKTFVTDAESTPGTPSQLTAVGGAGFITVTWDGKNSAGSNLTNFKQLDIYISGVPFNSLTPADSFFAAGTKTIAAPAGVYTLKAYAVSAIGTTSLVGAITTVTVTSSVIQVDPSEIPSAPTASSVLGAIQLAWNGKTAGNTDQPSGFKAAKVYVGTTAEFTPIDTGTVGANQVDVLNFGNGQNTLNIGLGTLVNGVALDHGIDYYIKIKTTNGNVLQDSTAVAATGNPVRVGQVQNGSLVTITADKISTGTLSSGSTITVGATSGKHIKLSGTGDPFTIYGSGGTSNPVLTFNGTKLSIVGDGTFTGNISGATGTLTNSLTVGTLYTDTTVSPNVQRYPFSVSGTGVMNAVSGTIAGWSLDGTSLQSTVSGTIKIDSGSAAIGATPARPAIISIGATSDNHIRITPSGIGTYTSSGTPTPNTSPGFSLASTGVLTLSGGILSGGSITAANFYLSTNTVSGDKIESNGAFRLGNGVISYTGSGDVSLNGASLSFTGASNVVFSDDNNYGGDSTVVLNQNSQLTRGRAFHYGGTDIPKVTNLSRNIWNSKTNAYDYNVPFNPGDIWMTVD